MGAEFYTPLAHYRWALAARVIQLAMKVGYATVSHLPETHPARTYLEGTRSRVDVLQEALSVEIRPWAHRAAWATLVLAAAGVVVLGMATTPFLQLRELLV